MHRYIRNVRPIKNTIGISYDIRRFYSKNIKIDPGLLDEAMSSADEIWDAALQRKKDEMSMIEAELSKAIKGSKEYEFLMKELQSVKFDIEGKDFDVNFRRIYDKGEAENVKMPLMRDLSNESFRNLYGPERLVKVAQYYKIFGDAVPASWSNLFSSAWENFSKLTNANSETDLFNIQNDENRQKMMNLVVDFRREISDDGVKVGEFPTDMDEFGDYMKENLQMFPWRGNLVTPETTATKPQIKLRLDSDDEKKERQFSLVLIDSDTPLSNSKTLIASPLWFLSNVKVTKSGIDLKNADEVIQYVPPHPQKGTGFHRYVWLALEQVGPDKITNSNILNELESHRWNMVSFLETFAFNDSPKDPKTAINFLPRAMVFHRAAHCDIVDKFYTDRKIQIPKYIYEQNSLRKSTDAPEKTSNGFVTVTQPPIYGKKINRTWEMVTRRLYKYAFL